MLNAAVLVLACVTLVSSVSRATMWETVFLAAYPDFEAAGRASVPERALNDWLPRIDPFILFPHSDYVLDARSIHYLHEKRLHERRQEPFRPSAAEFTGIFLVADADSEILEMIRGYWCGTPLVNSTEQYSVEELRLRAEHLAESYRAEELASQAVKRFFGS